MCSSEWSRDSQFDSVFGLVNGPVKPRSNLVNLGQTWSKLSKLWEMYLRPCFEGFWAWWTLVGSETAWSNLVNSSQTWSTLVKLSQILGNLSQTPFWGYLVWWALVGLGRLGSGCLVLRADSRENPGGKNGVMTIGYMVHSGAKLFQTKSLLNFATKALSNSFFQKTRFRFELLY